MHTKIDADSVSRLNTLLQQDIDWTYLLGMAERHGILPLLYWSLNTACGEAVPQGILEQLKTHFYVNACRSLFLTQELLKCLQLFEAHDITAIPYKGPALAATVYGNPALRHFSDLDILVRQQDVLKAKDLVLSQGYQPVHALTRRQEADFLRTRRVYICKRERPRISLEIHWHVVPRYVPFPIDLASVWHRLGTVCLDGKSVACLPPEELLLFLCVHGGKHGWERLKWIVDIAALVRMQTNLDWPNLIELARTLGSERLLHLGLSLAHDLLGTVLPQDVLRQIQADPVIPTLAKQVCNRLFQQTPDAPSKLAMTRFRCQVRERWRDRVQYCLRLAMTPFFSDWRWLPLPDGLAFLYYLLRPLRIGITYGLRLLRGLLGMPRSQAVQRRKVSENAADS